MASSSSSDEDDLIVLAAIDSASKRSLASSSTSSWTGRIKDSRGNVNRGECVRWQDYLSPAPTYSPSQFRRRFRLPLKLFRRLERDLPIFETALQQKTDAIGRKGPQPWQKILMCLRRLGEGCSFSSLDDQARMSVESMRQCFSIFTNAVIAKYGAEFLNREPSLSELRRIERKFSQSNFPGCIGSIDCMHMIWKNCPKAWKGQYRNPKNGKMATVQVEGMCDTDLYCWHIFCGRPGTNNDVTVAESSPLIISILQGQRRIRLLEGFMLGGLRKNWDLYFLADGIYPRWSIFLKPVHAPLTEKQKRFTKSQESRRKDVERLFGVLQGRFKIMRLEFYGWSDTDIINIVHTCTILHNMLVLLRLSGGLNDELDEDGNSMHPSQVVEECFSYEDQTEHGNGEIEPVAVTDNESSLSRIQSLVGVSEAVRDCEVHIRLQLAVENHIWHNS